jgi:TIMELESS-interacting protein
LSLSLFDETFLNSVFQLLEGKGEEFRDLDLVMKRMEHWAHRLYPKLPFEDVMNRISILGKKKTVQVKH